MEAILSKHAGTAFALIYFGTLGAVALWEAVAPRRALHIPLWRRWSGNFALMLIDGVLLRAMVPVTGIALAVAAHREDLAWLNVSQLSAWAGVPLAVVLLDLNRYMQHVALHKVPLLWCMHRTHHSDLEFDFTTQLRFHPFEAIFSIACFSIFIIVFGLPPEGVVLHSLLMATIGFVQHGNTRWWSGVDATFRRLVVTSDMHRIHHSADLVESTSNYGNVLSIWDRIFGTYLAQPAHGHDGMELGLAGYGEDQSQRLDRILLDPFVPHPSRVAQVSRTPDV